MGLSQQRLMERIRQAIPTAKPEDARLLLNEALETFCQETEVLLKEFPPITSVASQVYYDIDRKCLGIRQVDVEGETVNFLGGDEAIPMQD